MGANQLHDPFCPGTYPSKPRMLLFPKPMCLLRISRSGRSCVEWLVGSCIFGLHMRRIHTSRFPPRESLMMVRDAAPCTTSIHLVLRSSSPKHFYHLQHQVRTFWIYFRRPAASSSQISDSPPNVGKWGILFFPSLFSKLVVELSPLLLSTIPLTLPLKT